MDDRSRLLLRLAEAGVPDRIGWFGGIRGRVADMLIQAIKDRGKPAVLKAMTDVVDIAARIAGASPETP